MMEASEGVSHVKVWCLCDLRGGPRWSVATSSWSAILCVYKKGHVLDHHAATLPSPKRSEAVPWGDPIITCECSVVDWLGRNERLRQEKGVY
jgi:hypothetical protein